LNFDKSMSPKSIEETQSCACFKASFAQSGTISFEISV
jgi:hypothetical protein